MAQKRVIVVDDERVIREACARILSRAGFHIETAANGAEALERIKNDRFDLAVVDIKMPVMDGMELLDVIAREKPGLKVVVITGHGTKETGEQAFQAGALDFLTKPFTPKELRQSLYNALNGKKSDFGKEGEGDA